MTIDFSEFYDCYVSRYINKKEVVPLLEEFKEKYLGRHFSTIDNYFNVKVGEKGIILGINSLLKEKDDEVYFLVTALFPNNNDLKYNSTIYTQVDDNSFKETRIENCYCIPTKHIKVGRKAIIPKNKKEKACIYNSNIIKVDGRFFPIYNIKNKNRNKKCKCCGDIINNLALASKTKKGYVCNGCSAVKSYSTQNNTFVKAPTKKGFTYGYELESVVKATNNSKYKDKIAEVVSLGYNIIPTADGSLPRFGVEFKTPVMRSLKGTKTMLKKMEEYVNFKNHHCGQHINIGNTIFYNYRKASLLRAFAQKIFNPLGAYLKANPLITEKVCGRNFTHFAKYTGKLNNYNDHCSWINLTEDNRIEFRISKINSVEQYVKLTKLWTDVMTCINTNFFEKVTTDMDFCDKDKFAKACGKKVKMLFINRINNFV